MRVVRRGLLRFVGSLAIHVLLYVQRGDLQCQPRRQLHRLSGGDLQPGGERGVSELPFWPLPCRLGPHEQADAFAELVKDAFDASFAPPDVDSDARA